MAKVGGRVSWIAWPAMLAAITVVGALVWLAIPAVPGTVDFIGGTLRGATAQLAEAEAGPPAAEPATDCRSLYPDRIWSELSWTPDVLLTPSTAAPPAPEPLVAALGPEVRFTCTWRSEDGRTIATSVSGVRTDAAAIGAGVLAAEGFTCEIREADTLCERSAGGAEEFHVFTTNTWVASAADRWPIDGYRDDVVSHAIPR